MQFARDDYERRRKSIHVGRYYSMTLGARQGDAMPYSSWVCLGSCDLEASFHRLDTLHRARCKVTLCERFVIGAVSILRPRVAGPTASANALLFFFFFLPRFHF